MKYQTHSDVQGRDGYGLVLNVKCHVFDFAESGTDEQRERAYSRAQESWWRGAKQAARKLGFDGVYSAGRMGGYIYPTFDGRAVTAADLDRSPYGYGRNRASRLVSMMRKFRKYVRGAMDRDKLEAMFADELRYIIAEDAEREAEDAEREAEQAARDALPGRLAEALRASIKSLELAVQWAQVPNNAAMREDLANARAVLADYDDMESGE